MVEYELVLLLSTQVDDLKGGGVNEETTALFKFLEDAVGKGKLDWGTFAHCGVNHEQSKDKEQITINMDKYVKQLQPIQSPELGLEANPLDLASPALMASYLSLVGALAWLTQLRADMSVYVVALQRRNTIPPIQHIKRCNRVLSYVKRHPLSLRHVRIEGTPRIVGVSDSAYKVEEDDARALAGHFVLFMGQSVGQPTVPKPPFGTCVMLDYTFRRQKRVCRSTFAAEIVGLNDCVETSRTAQLAVEECLYGPSSATQALKLEEPLGATTASSRSILECAIDARSVREAVKAKETKTPAESSLVSSVQSVRELFDLKRLNRLRWIDTRDMCSDGFYQGPYRPLGHSRCTGEKYVATSWRQSVGHHGLSSVHPLVGRWC